MDRYKNNLTKPARGRLSSPLLAALGKFMDKVDIALDIWNESLCKKISVGELFSRNPVVHKWKAPFRTLLLRESISWRLHDLLCQSKVLSDSDHLLGARILLRSSFETLALLVYLNNLMTGVVKGNLSYSEFSNKTTKMLLGSRNKATSYESINILTIITKADKKYQGILKSYEELSESVHPNYDGLSKGYSEMDHIEYETTFSNRWCAIFSKKHNDRIALCIDTFVEEYNKVWDNAFNELESWMEQNDEELEAQRDEA
jgi:hypothetical protein